MASITVKAIYSPSTVTYPQHEYYGSVVEEISTHTGIGQQVAGLEEVDKWSVINYLPCKFCGKSHGYTSVNCGTPLFWYKSELHLAIGPGEKVPAPNNAIHFRQWQNNPRSSNW